MRTLLLIRTAPLILSRTLLVRLIERESPNNRMIIRASKYPDPGSNRDGSESTGV